MSKYKDTIYALSTPTGRSAIAVIRISGDQSLNTLKKISSLGASEFYSGSIPGLIINDLRYSSNHSNI